MPCVATDDFLRHVHGRQALRPESDSRAVRERLEAEDQVCVSELMRPELMGVFHRRMREGKWTRDEFLTVVRQFSTDDLGGFWTWLPLDTAITEAAARAYTTLPEASFFGLRIVCISSRQFTRAAQKSTPTTDIKPTPRPSLGSSRLRFAKGRVESRVGRWHVAGGRSPIPCVPKGCR